MRVGPLVASRMGWCSRKACRAVCAHPSRPPVIETYDMRGNLTRTLNFLNSVVNLNASDFASDSDNQWTDEITSSLVSGVTATLDEALKTGSCLAVVGAPGSGG